MSFRANDAVFEGFRITREKPVLLVWLGLVYLAANLVVMGLTFPHIGAMQAAVEAFQQITNPTQEDVLRLLEPMSKVSMVSLPMSLLTLALVLPAIVRAVRDSENGRFGYLRLGRSELNVALVAVVMWLAWAALLFAILTIAGIGFAAGPAVGALVMLIAIIGFIVASVWLTVRFSLVVPVTVAEQRIGFRESLRLTKGHFWPLLGMGVLASVLSIGVMLLGNMVQMPFGLMSGGGLDLLQGKITTGSVIGFAGVMILGSLISAATAIIMLAPFAKAYGLIKNS